MDDAANKTGLNELKLTDVMEDFLPLLKWQNGDVVF